MILTAAGGELALLERHAADLPMLFIVSDVELRAAPSGGETRGEAPALIEIARADGTKCDRCWRYVAAVSAEPEWTGLCARCQDALAEPARG